MSGYSEMYQQNKDAETVRQHCPTWAKDERFEVRLAIAEGVEAKKRFAKIRADLECLRRLTRSA